MSILLTPQGKANIEQKLEELKQQRPLLAQRIAAAKELGDLSENAEYSAAKQEQGRTESEIRRLENLLKNARVVDAKDKETVTLGCRVKLEGPQGKREYEITGQEESDPLQGKISYESPLGRALLNKKVGQEVRVVTPGGERLFRITAIE